MTHATVDLPLFQNFTNVVHPIEGAEGERPLLLLNMSVNYGIAIGPAAAAVVEAARDGATAGQIAERLDLAPAAVVSLAGKLLELGFLSEAPTAAERTWVPEGFNIEKAEDYP